jgi:hypothetical protein
MRTYFKSRRVFPVTQKGLLRTSATCLLCEQRFAVEREQMVAAFVVEDEVVAFVCDSCAPRKRLPARRTSASGGDEVPA